MKKRTHADIHRTMRPLQTLARAMDYLENPDPDATFESNNAAISLAASERSYPQNRHFRAAVNSDLFIKGSGVKKCAYVGTVSYLWGEDSEYGPYLAGFRISTEPYILRDALTRGIIQPDQHMQDNPLGWHRDRPIDLAWAAQRFFWLWEHSDMTGHKPPAGIDLWVTKKGQYYTDNPDGSANFDQLETLASRIGSSLWGWAQNPSDVKKLTVRDLLTGLPMSGAVLTFGNLRLAFTNNEWLIVRIMPDGAPDEVYRGPDEDMAARLFLDNIGFTEKDILTHD